MPQLEVVPELRDQLGEYLQKQGYRITPDAKLTGKSGVKHTFDMLAEKDDGFTSHTVAICIAQGGNKEQEASTIFSFANKAYDTGINNRLLVAVSEFSDKSKQLAGKQRIKVIDGKQISTLIDFKPKSATSTEAPLKYDTRSELIESLLNRGYKVEEKAKAKGKSGVEYTFDILANIDIEQVSHTLAIDFLDADKEVGLAQVALFDTKAYDVGVDSKVIIISPGLSADARQFAEHQGIKVLESGQKVAKEIEILEKVKARLTSKTQAQAKMLKQKPQPEALQLIPEVMARRYNAVPLTISGNTLQVAMADATDVFALEAFAAQSRMRIEPIAADPKDIREAIDLNYKGYGEIEQQVSRINIPAEATDEAIAIGATVDTPLTQALNLIIEEAVKARASDIHIEPEEDRLRIRYRIDGILQDMMSLPLNIRRSVISRIKILSDLNIADHQHPQDGQFSTVAKGREIDVRVATAPSVWGEMSVLRLLDKSMALLELSSLGMLDDSLARYHEMLKVPHGMILVSGPTGAGKTTTLYASLNSLDKIGRNVITIEDPAEYRFKDINQIQVNVQASITFASGLRSILRLDPDVILVGEIRDAETANIAVQAALTGHMMLSSIHASDTPGVIFRLIDLKIEPFLIASTVIGIVSQRMVRKVCPDCAQPIEVPVVEQLAYEKEMGEKRTKFIYGTGCKSCAYTGYQGRTGIFEIMSMSDSIRTLLVNKSTSNEIRAQALKEGMVSLIKDGMRKVKAEITTPSEILRSAYTLG
jgi:general secretion pathway protein E